MHDAYLDFAFGKTINIFCPGISVIFGKIMWAIIDFIVPFALKSRPESRNVTGNEFPDWKPQCFLWAALKKFNAPLRVTKSTYIRKNINFFTCVLSAKYQPSVRGSSRKRIVLFSLKLKLYFVFSTKIARKTYLYLQYGRDCLFVYNIK